MPRGRPRGNDEARFYSHVEVGEVAEGMDSRCWIWTGAPAGGGYAQFQTGGRTDKRVTAVHRWIYEHIVGPIPEGYQIDHLCKVRTCVNVDHLEAVPSPVNNARSDSPSAINARMTLCARGLHELSGDNLHPTYLRHGQRRCKACRAERQREYRARRRQATPNGVPA